MLISPSRTNPKPPADFQRRSLWRRLGIACLLALWPLAAQAQDPAPPDTGYFEDDYYYDEYFDDEGYFDDEYADDEYYDDEFGGDEYYDDEYYDDEGGGFDEYYDDEGFDDQFSEGELEAFEGQALDDSLALADPAAGEVELQEIEQREIKEPRIPLGYTAKLTIASPWLVGLAFDSWWYSLVDGRLTLDFPQKTLAGQTLSYSLELGSYSFVNQHPSGGAFKGIAMLAYLRFPWGPLELSTGGGLYGFDVITGGIMLGTSYRVPFIRFMSVTVDTRLNYVLDTGAGAAYWMDIGGSLGYVF